MQYTKLFFLSASVLTISGMVFAMQEQEQKPKYVNVLYEGRKAEMIPYSPQEPVRELIRDVKQKMNIPQETNIRLLFEARSMDEDKLCSSYNLSSGGSLRAVVARQ